MSNEKITALTAGTIKSTDVYIAVDTTDTSMAPSGTDKKYTFAQILANIASVGYLLNTNNLSDVSSASTARTNLGLGSAATQSTSTFLQATNNLSDLTNDATARSNLGLGGAAIANPGNTVISIAGLLEVASPVTSTPGNSTAYTATLRGETLVRSNSGSPMSDTIAQAGTSGLINGFYFDLINNDTSAILTITPSGSTINGGSTLVLQPHEGARISSNGTNYFASVNSGSIGAGFLLASNNLSDVSSVSISRTNLGLGSAAVNNISTTIAVSSGALVINSPVTTSTGASLAYTSALRGNTLLRSNSGSAMTDSIAQAGTAGLTTGFFFDVLNTDSAGAITITPTTSTINGASTLVLAHGYGARISSDGTNYFAIVSSGLTSSGFLLASNNLSDVSSASTARTNLGLGSSSTLNTGNSVVSISGALEQASPSNVQAGASYTYLTTDRAKTVYRSNSGSAMSDTLPQAGVSFPNGWLTYVDNIDATGSITITPTTSTINGASSLLVQAGYVARITSDGTNYFAFIANKTTVIPLTLNQIAFGNGQLTSSASLKWVASQNSFVAGNSPTLGGSVTGGYVVGDIASVSANNAGIFAGVNNTVTTNGLDGAIIGGNNNTVDGSKSFIAVSDTCSTTGSNSAIITSVSSTITTSGNATILNGQSCTITAAGSGSLVSGFHGSAASTGSYVFADGSSATPFQSTVNNSFIIRAVGGVGINQSAPDASASLDIVSTTTGFLPPRMTTTNRLAISSPGEGLQVYDLTLHKMAYFNGTIWTLL